MFLVYFFFVLFFTEDASSLFCFTINSDTMNPFIYFGRIP